MHSPSLRRYQALVESKVFPQIPVLDVLQEHIESFVQDAQIAAVGHDDARHQTYLDLIGETEILKSSRG